MKFLPAILVLLLAPAVLAGTLKAGYAERDITPTAPMPMWGYGARHDMLAEGTLDPLHASAVVLEAGDAKLAIVGLDLGRAPTFRSMERIQDQVADRAGVQHLLICGSHTHHGPVIELLDEPGKGQGKFDAAVAYVTEMEDAIIAAIVEAAGKTVPAKIGWNSGEVPLNRNRQAKEEPKPKDAELALIRLDTLDGAPIALIVNFAAHPVIHDIRDLRWTWEWPGHMARALGEAAGAPVVFIQGAAGDMSPNPEGEWQMVSFGQEVAAQVAQINADLETRVPENPAIQVMEDRFDFKTRLDLQNPMVQAVFRHSFFPELLAMLDEIPADEIHPRLSTVLLNGELALVGGSGEFFSTHALRLKQHSPAKKTLFFGYCNGHQMYFPTLEAIEQGGYGADPPVAWAEPGAGEKMIEKALENLKTLLSPE